MGAVDEGGTERVCSACAAPNRPESKFCGECGRPLTAVIPCPRCGEDNPVGQRFCNECGAGLGTAEGSAPAESAPADFARSAAGVPEAPAHLVAKARAQAGSLAGERKQVTVLFADVMGSMDLAERTDPERWQAIIGRFFQLLAESVHRFEGTVDKFTGDGIMALFGAPIAHEDHAQRACYAALEIQSSVAEYAAELRRSDGISFTTRVGLNSGEVVVGSIGERGSVDYTAVGHTVGLAQRMESLAEPGRAYMTEHTARLAAGFLDLRDLGEFEVKGSSAPLGVFELIGVGSARGRLDVARERGFSRFVGRSAEIEQLEAALERAEAGDGEAVGIVADPGIGKSRLCHEFLERCRARGIEVYETQCQAHGRSLPLMPVLQMLRAYFGIEPGDSDREARERIAGRLLLLDPDFADDLGLVFDFLAVPDPERPAPAINPEARQRRLLDLIRRLVQARGRDQTVVNVIEDLHWIDPASELFLRTLVEAVPGTRTLIVTNFRPEYGADWMRHSYYRQLPLTPLGHDALDELLRDQLGDDPSLDGLAELIRERTGGNPFYVEEAVRELVESGSLQGGRGSYRLVTQIDEIAVPPTVQAILAARIDRLSEGAKLVLQAAAAIGKEFGRELLLRAAELPADAVDAALRQLVEAEFVFETALYPEPEYAFRHPLTQEVAYRSQLAGARCATHARIAAGLEELDPERLDENAALIAQHYEQAERGMEAAMWHARAAGWSGFNDPGAAREHWARIREIDAMLPDTEEADSARMVARLMSLSVGWRVGADLDEARQVFAEGVELARRRGDLAAEALAHGALGVAVGVCSGDVPEYVELAERAAELSQRIDEPNSRVAVETGLMYPFYLAGRYDEALATLDRVLEMTADDPELGAGIVIANPRAWASSFRALPLGALGRFDEMREALAEGIELCRRWDRESLGWTHTFHIGLARMGVTGFDAETLAHGRQSVEIADAIGDGFSRVVAYAWYGYAQLYAGNVAEALEHLETCLESVDRLGVARESEPVIRAWHGRALAINGDGDRALEVGDMALRLCEERGTVYIAPAVRLLLVETLLELGGDADLLRAEVLVEDALAHSRALRQVSDDVDALRLRARVHGALGREQEREAGFAEALELAREIGAARFVEELEGELALTS